ncbi:hypothetical protein FEM48_Zijuj07G0026900 [Ziziphus jujuba var. spinosa]|uniref:23 kDa jasmonate-induced protein-like n=1 Tax=Ziziphus jujuba var. spinosa TaxID=714518 RepID=A0A978V1Z6_ZIZJJ|nr:23 kDa jasmonate-induced protein-like [Ziziphus jujuba var. spinosa]KAH7521379.1 hypothetical protein FEM48_Zijuj07G0026900 [Ziziphus jujuba var. spinosa]
MAVSVFGNPITNSTLEGRPEFAGKKDIQKIDRARAALNSINSDDTQENSLQHVEKLKEKLGNTTSVGVVTFGIVSNATGDPVKYVTHHDWLGKIAPPGYPQVIENGQSGGFLHVAEINVIIPPGSVGAVVYRSQSREVINCDFMLAWNNPSDSSEKTAYTEVHEVDHFFDWDIIYKKLKASGSECESQWNEYVSNFRIRKIGQFSVFEAKLKLN